MGQLLYFAYGATLPHDRVTALCPGADWLGSAQLEDHRLDFDTRGYPTARPAAGETVWGALWLLPSTTLPDLDAGEGAATGLALRTTARVISPAGPRTEAMLYLSTDKKTGSPAAELISRMLVGAANSRLPKAYVEKLRQLTPT